jgi:hypothetical protein
MPTVRQRDVHSFTTQPRGSGGTSKPLLRGLLGRRRRQGNRNSSMNNRRTKNGGESVLFQPIMKPHDLAPCQWVPASCRPCQGFATHAFSRRLQIGASEGNSCNETPDARKRPSLSGLVVTLILFCVPHLVLAQTLPPEREGRAQSALATTGNSSTQAIGLGRESSLGLRPGSSLRLSDTTRYLDRPVAGFRTRMP